MSTKKNALKNQGTDGLKTFAGRGTENGEGEDSAVLRVRGSGVGRSVRSVDRARGTGTCRGAGPTVRGAGPRVRGAGPIVRSADSRGRGRSRNDRKISNLKFVSS